jgi:hypothetical protein
LTFDIAGRNLRWHAAYSIVLYSDYLCGGVSARSFVYIQEAFRHQVSATLAKAGKPLTWTEIRTAANLPQAFPNNQWVHRMERDLGLVRRRESDGTIHWQLASEELPLGGSNSKTPETS